MRIATPVLQEATHFGVAAGMRSRGASLRALGSRSLHAQTSLYHTRLADGSLDTAPTAAGAAGHEWWHPRRGSTQHFRSAAGTRTPVSNPIPTRMNCAMPCSEAVAGDGEAVDGRAGRGNGHRTPERSQTDVADSCLARWRDEKVEINSSPRFASLVKEAIGKAGRRVRLRGGFVTGTWAGTFGVQNLFVRSRFKGNRYQPDGCRTVASWQGDHEC